MCDDRAETRLDALNKILQARQSYKGKQLVKPSPLPAVNFDALDYTEMIDWSNISYISPPLLQKVSNEELTAKLSNDKVYKDWIFCSLPCHTVAVERMVKLVTEASDNKYGTKNRDGYIRGTLESRSKMAKFDSKQDFAT